MRSPETRLTMTTAVLLKRARENWELLESIEMARSDLNRQEARLKIAEREKVSVSTADNLMKRRLKDIGAYVYRQIYLATIKELRAEIARLEHELELRLAHGEDPDGFEVGAVVAYIASARQALGLPSRGAPR